MARVKKIINAIPDLVPEVLEGLVLASHDDLHKLDGADAVVRNHIPDGKVALLIGGGSATSRCTPAMWARASPMGRWRAMSSPPHARHHPRSHEGGESRQGRHLSLWQLRRRQHELRHRRGTAAAEDIAIETIRIADDIVTPERKERRASAAPSMW